MGPDGQPITQLDGGFDHWGDSSINYLVSTQSVLLDAVYLSVIASALKHVV